MSERGAPPQQPESRGSDQTLEVDAVVFALIPEYGQLKVRDADGRVYAITRKTQGVDLGALREGQHVRCTVTRKLPRVLVVEVVG